jgi:ribonuclease P protein component
MPVLPDPPMTTPANPFGPAVRLRTGREYAAVKAGGVAFRGPHCMVLALGRPGEPTRIGFIASKKGVGNAVERNRARRRLREIVRLRWPRVPATGYWLVLIAARGTVRAEHQDLANSVEHVLAAAGALAPIMDPDSEPVMEIHPTA